MFLFFFPFSNLPKNKDHLCEFVQPGQACVYAGAQDLQEAVPRRSHLHPRGHRLARSGMSWLVDIVGVENRQGQFFSKDCI